MKTGDRVAYVGLRTKYENLLGTVGKVFSNGSFFVKFDNDDGGIFSHTNSFALVEQKPLFDLSMNTDVQ